MIIDPIECDYCGKKIGYTVRTGEGLDYVACLYCEQKIRAETDESP